MTHFEITKPSERPRKAIRGIHDGSIGRAHEWMAWRRWVGLDGDFRSGYRPGDRHVQQKLQEVIIEPNQCVMVTKVCTFTTRIS
jgi:hypothetical protein